MTMPGGDSARSHSPRPNSDDQEDADLVAAIADLGGMVTGCKPLVDVLHEVAGYATHAIPHADGAGVVVLRLGDGPRVVHAVAASAPFVTEVDAIQYRLNEGPCITAAADNRTVRSGSLGGERAWSRFGPRTGRLGIHSSLSIPLVVHGRVTGTLNVYSRSKHAFDEHAATLGEAFAAPAAVSLFNAQVLDRAHAMADRLQNTLANRTVIDQAIGIIRTRTGGSADEAMDRLRTISQNEHVKLAAVAENIIDEAVGRARARREPGSH